MFNIVCSLSVLCGVLSVMPEKVLAIQEGPFSEFYDDLSIADVRVEVENLPAEGGFSEKEILANLQTVSGGVFSQYTFDQDLKYLAETYHKVEPVFDIRDKQMFIVLKVWLRPSILGICWSGNKKFSTATLNKELDFSKNEIFNQSLFDKSICKVHDYYLKKGYYSANIQYDLIETECGVEIKIQVSEGSIGRVKKIKIQGLSPCEEKELCALLHTKEYSNFTSWFTGYGLFHEEALEQDRLKIFQFLQNKGYADAHISLNTVEDEKQGLILDIHIEKGPVYYFGTVSFSGNTLFSDNLLISVFSVAPKTRYSMEELQKTLSRLKNTYGTAGYMDAEIAFKLKLDPQENIYHVHYTIVENCPSKIGLIHVLGNKNTNTSIILRYAGLTPGLTFDANALDRAQKCLEALKYFKNVHIYTVEPTVFLPPPNQYVEALKACDSCESSLETEDSCSCKDVYIEVEEGPTGRFALTAGINSGNSFSGGIEITETNFRLGGLASVPWCGLCTLRGGGECFRARANFGARQQEYSMTWVSPTLCDSLWSFGFNIDLSPCSQIISEEYDMHSYSCAVFASHPICSYFSYGTKARAKNFSTTVEVPGTAIKKDVGTLFGLSSSITWDNTFPSCKPQQGLRSSLEAEYVFLDFSDQTYFLTKFLSAYYLPLTNTTYMRYRAEWKFLFPAAGGIAQIPLSERFFLGGASSVRGYVDFSLGPHKNINGYSLPEGGISSTFLSMEFVQDICGVADLFFFIDGGYLSSYFFTSGQLQMSYGVGINTCAPGGIPLYIGYGIPVNPISPNQEKRFFFSFGGQF